MCPRRLPCGELDSRLLKMFDVRGKLTVENNEKVFYASCLPEP